MASYTRINATTKTNLTDQAAKAQEELWVKGVTGDAYSLYQQNPFGDGMSANATMVGGEMRGGGGLNKAILNVRDTTKVEGNTVNIPTWAGLAGPGVFGEGDRIGAEQKFRVGNTQVQIGRAWYGAGWTAVARDETVIGSQYDMRVATGLREQVAKKKSDDIMMKIRQRAGTSGRNYILPTGVANRNALTASNVFSTSMITRINLGLQRVGAVPMALGRDNGGSSFSRFVILGTNDGMAPLKNESAYLDGITNAGVRGDANPLFQGNFVDWDGVGLYRWEQLNHGNYGPVGSPLLPRAFLGGALDVSGTTTGLLVKGGGSAAAAAVTPAPNYFEFFSNSPYTFTHGETIAADTTTDRYLLITNPDGTKAVIRYRNNDGTKITLPASSVVTVTGYTATALVEGALIEECNSTGIPFVREIGLGQNAIFSGAGSIKGANGASGIRTMEERNHGMEFAVGIDYSWGCEAFKRPDGIYPGFVLAESAMASAA